MQRKLLKLIDAYVIKSTEMNDLLLFCIEVHGSLPDFYGRQYLFIFYMNFSSFASCSRQLYFHKGWEFSFPPYFGVFILMKKGINICFMTIIFPSSSRIAKSILLSYIFSTSFLDFDTSNNKHKCVCFQKRLY